jgi:hypothetical protein
MNQLLLNSFIGHKPNAVRPQVGQRQWAIILIHLILVFGDKDKAVETVLSTSNITLYIIRHNTDGSLSQNSMAH